MKEPREIEQYLIWLFHEEQKTSLGVSGIRAALTEVLHGYGGRRFKLHPGSHLYRVVRNEERGQKIDFLEPNTSRLMAPPIEYAFKSRCNDQGERLLYCGEHPIVSLAELKRFQAGDVFTFIILKVVRDLAPVSFVNVDTLLGSHSQLKSFLTNHFSKKSNRYSPQVELIDTMFGKEYMRPVDTVTQQFHYHTTIAWRQLCFEQSDSKCLIYPTVASSLRLANYAFDPEFAHDVLRPTDVYRCRIVDVDPNEPSNLAIKWEHHAELSDYGSYELQPIANSDLDYATWRDVGKDPFEGKHAENG